MKLFVAYASEDRDSAEQIALALGSKHQVFFDRTNLHPGADYNARIREEISNSDGVVFLISPESVAPGSYALTEMEFARDRWPHPAGHVIPVMTRPTPFESIPNYLKAVTVLEPVGDPAAEVAAAAADRIKPKRRWVTHAFLAIAAAAVVIPLAVIIPRDTADPGGLEPDTNRTEEGGQTAAPGPATIDSAGPPPTESRVESDTTDDSTPAITNDSDGIEPPAEDDPPMDTIPDIVPVELPPLGAILHFSGNSFETARFLRVIRESGFVIHSDSVLFMTGINASEVVVNHDSVAARVTNLVDDLKRVRPDIVLRIDRERVSNTVLVRLTASGG